jgi:transcriptional regulator with XRE-family HTH domain
MRDLIKLSEEIVSEIPELQPYFTGMASVYAELTLYNRMKQGLTQAQLSERAGVSPKTIHRVEAGNDNGIGIKTYESIFRALEIDFGDIGEAFKKKSTNQDLVGV